MGALEPIRWKGKVMHLVEEEGYGKGMGMLLRRRVGWVLHPKGF